MGTGTIVFGAACSFVLGAAAALLWMVRPPRVQRNKDDLILKVLSGCLKLTGDQKSVIKQIVGEMRAKLDHCHGKIRSEIWNIYNDSFTGIEKQLDEQQKDVFRRFRDRWDMTTT